MGRLYDAYVSVGPRFEGMGDVKTQGAKAGKEYAKALVDAAEKAAKADVRRIGEVLAKARLNEADAIGKVRVAEAKLNETRGDSKAKASQVAAAEEALAAAQRKSAKASDVASGAAKDLDKARDKVAKAAEGAGTAGGNRFTSGFKNALSKFKPETQGKQIATRFGVGLNGAIGSVVSKSAGIFAAGFAAVKVGGVAKDAINLEATFSQTMNTMAAAAKVPASGIKSLSDLAIKMGADTTFSASEAATAMLELAKGGLSAATIQSGALSGTLTLAAAGGTSLETAATIASNALNTFNLSGKDMASVAAALAGGANASSASVESLGQALSQVGPGATTAGLTLQDTVGVLSSFDAAGIKGADAGTSLKTMLTRLVPTTKASADAMKNLGLKFTDANGKFVPITNVAQQLKDKLSGLSDEQKTTALSTIFGSDATRAATVLMKQGATGIGKYIAATKDQGAAQDVASARMKGTAGAIESFKGSIETAKLQLGQFLAPAVQGGLKVLTKGLNGIAPAAQKLSPIFKDVSLGVQAFGQAFKGEGVTSGGFVGVMERLGVSARNLIEAFKPLAKDVGRGAVAVFQKLAPVLQSFGSFLGGTVVASIREFTGFLKENKTLVGAFAVGIGAMVIAFKAYQFTIVAVTAVTKAWAAIQVVFNAIMDANPIGIIALALVGLAAGLIYAYKHSETFRDIVNGAFNVVKGIVIGVFNDIKAVVGGVVTAFNAVKGAIGTAFGAVGSALGAVVVAVKTAFSAAVGFVVSIWSTIVSAVSGPVTAVVAVLTAIWSRIMPILVLPFYIAKSVIATTFAGIQIIFTTVAGWVTTAFAKAWSAVVGVLSGPVNLAKNAIGTAWSGIETAFLVAKNWVTGAFSKAWSAVKSVLSGPISLAKSALDAAWSGIKGAFNAAKNYATGAFSKAWSALKTTITTPISLAVKGLSVVLGAAKGGVQWVFKQAVAGISTIWNGLQSLAKKPIKFIIDTVLNKGLIAGFNWIANKFQAPTIDPIPLPKGFAQGGKIPGRPSAVDNTFGFHKGGAIPLATGEFIVNARQTAKNLPLLTAINKGDGYADGGLFGSLKNAVGSAYAKGKNFVGDIADFTKDAAGWFKNKFKGPLSQLDQLGNSSIAKIVTAVPRRIADTIVGKAKDLLSGLFGAGAGPNTPVGKVVSFRGEKLNQRTIAMLLSAEAALHRTFHIMQGSYSTRVSASGSTHAGGGAMDTDNAGAGWDKAVNALRAVGFAAWHRTPAMGPWGHHIHSIAIGDPTASPAAKAQVRDFQHGGDGLGGMVKGGLLRGYASGAWEIVRDQLAMVHKGEMVVPAKAADPLRKLLPSLGNWNQRVRGKLHQLHEAHLAHQAHLAHVTHLNHLGNSSRLPSRSRLDAILNGRRPPSGDTTPNGVTGNVRLHPDDIRAVAYAVADAVTSNPMQVNIDGRKLDNALSRSSAGRGF